jgi:hypothetical protein
MPIDYEPDHPARPATAPPEVWRGGARGYGAHPAYERRVTKDGREGVSIPGVTEEVYNAKPPTTASDS